MVDIFEIYATDEVLENAGTWRDIGEGSRLLIARAGNKAYGKALSAAVEKNQRALDAKTEAAETLSESIMQDVLARTVLLGWEGISFKGEELAYSVDNARTLLAVKDFRLLVNRLAGEAEAYKYAKDAEAKKP